MVRLPDISASPTERRPRAPERGARLMLVATAVVGAFLIAHFTAPLPGWTREAAFMAAIFFLAAFLWATEALPLFATALLTIALEIVLLANPGHWPGFGFATTPSPNYREIITAAADPILLLFLGGFLLARAASKERVDRAMSSLLLRPFGQRPMVVAFGIMCVTATFSMWMSNTATTAMMLTLVTPMLAQVPAGDPFRKVLVLGVPFAANIGGIGTPIASPPNAVALSFLQKSGRSIPFLDWMLAALPLMIALLVVAWAVLWFFHRPRATVLRLQPPVERLTGRAWFVVAVFAITVALWMTDAWHGLPAAVVALLPAVALTVTGVLDHRDVNSLEWNILLLIGGGIALGAGMQLTGLDKILLGYLLAGGATPALLIATLVGVTVLLGTFMSNTATANLVIPIGMSSAAAFGGDFGVLTAFSIALAASMSMSLPISTPPNTMAYATREITTRDMVIPGTCVAVIGAVAVALLAKPMLRLWGIVP